MTLAILNDEGNLEELNERLKIWHNGTETNGAAKEINFAGRLSTPVAFLQSNDNNNLYISSGKMGSKKMSLSMVDLRNQKNQLMYL